MGNAESPGKNRLGWITQPVSARPALVKCAHCRCLAYRDKEGKWRDYFYHDELPEVLEVIELAE